MERLFDPNTPMGMNNYVEVIRLADRITAETGRMAVIEEAPLGFRISVAAPDANRHGFPRLPPLYSAAAVEEFLAAAIDDGQPN